MTKKQKFMCALRRFRRNYFPTPAEKRERREFTMYLLKAGKDIDFYVNNLLGKKG